jgi:prolyl 4-hydroxylase
VIRLVEEIKGLLSLRLFAPATCKRIIKHAERANDWAAASVGEESNGNYESAVRPQYRAALTYSPSAKSFVQREVAARIDTNVLPQLNRAWRTQSLRLADTHIVRYVPGGFYVTHADAGLDLNNRFFTVLCYLNDGYEGGKTSFPTLEFSVTPETGKAIVFPATYLHCAEPVLHGTKYILVSWLVGHESPEWI